METCKVDTALEILMGKWKHRILFELTNNEVMRFNELKRAIPGITQKMLTAQLRELEHHDIVIRRVYAQIPPKVEYSMTEYGNSLQPLLGAMHEWGSKHAQHLKELEAEEALKPNNA
ncbi:winged helix-turn-helix transcriptional regulator [Alkalicoccobacillus plakortidis]|uniref:Winged helix-turn-helix transcriptional regulator n=1 Tax=Alkalicoccobacillus plakortidis TaxID=444060 RepID=A0ABT0XP99_9BACI|nr:winged helix-turn-helix transcriptional regulator [Alkalicoccobacillus plakortidis]MCM2677097.1 winged helix-turn-helix transcriptional regulator [Alkalicoccobacillus plakortidis]